MVIASERSVSFRICTCMHIQDTRMTAARAGNAGLRVRLALAYAGMERGTDVRMVLHYRRRD